MAKQQTKTNKNKALIYANKSPFFLQWRSKVSFLLQITKKPFSPWVLLEPRSSQIRVDAFTTRLTHPLTNRTPFTLNFQQITNWNLKSASPCFFSLKSIIMVRHVIMCFTCDQLAANEESKKWRGKLPYCHRNYVRKFIFPK